MRGPFSILLTLLLHFNPYAQIEDFISLTWYPLHTVTKRAAVFTARLFSMIKETGAVAAVCFGLIHPSCRGFAAACDHQPRPVGMLRTQRKEEEEEEGEEGGGGGYIYPSLPYRSEGWSVHTESIRPYRSAQTGVEQVDQRQHQSEIQYLWQSPNQNYNGSDIWIRWMKIWQNVLNELWYQTIQQVLLRFLLIL